MVDNVDITPGTGKTIAADDVGGVLHQRAKVTWGPDGTANDADTASGKPLPIQLRGSDGTDRAGQATASASIPVVLASDVVSQIGAAAKSIVVTPTVSASPDYGIGDVLGGKMTLDGMARVADKTGVLPWCMMTCDVDIPDGVTVDVLIFSADPTNSTFTDNSAVAVNVADLHFLCGIIQLDTRIDLGTPAALIPSAAGTIPFKAASGTDDLFAVAVVRDAATLNLAGTSDINFIFGALQD
jgi:hypothetical protein